MKETKRLIKNTGIVALGNMGAKVASFLLLPLYTSVLSTEDYGVYDFIVAVSAFLLPIITCSLHEAMFRYIIQYKGNIEKIRVVITHVFCVIFCGITFFSLFIFILRSFVVVEYSISLMLYVISSVLYIVAVNLLRGMDRIQEYAIISSIKNIFQVLLNVLVIAVFKWGVNGLIFSMCASEILAFLVVALRVQLWKWIRADSFSKEQIRELFTYSLPLVPNAICAQIINMSDRLIITTALGPSLNGVYSISYKFPNIVETMYHYFYTAWSESASRTIEENKESANQYYQKLYNTLDGFIFSGILLMIAFMPILFRIFIRGDYIRGFSYVPLLMLAIYFDCLGKFYSGIYTAYKNTKILAVSTIVAAVVNIIINILFIKLWGLYVAAASTLFAEVCLCIIRKQGLRKYLRLKIDIKKRICKLLGFIGIIIFYRYDDWTSIILGITLAIVFFVCINHLSLKTILELLKNKIGKRV